MKWLIPLCLCGLQLTAHAVTYEERAVAAVLMGEAWSEGVPGMTAVAEVIHQRSVEKKRAPYEVITSPRAFSCLNQTTVDRLIRKFSIQPDFEKALEVAETMCQNPTKLPGITNEANHYTRTTERPFWARGRHPVAIVGQHAFYRLDHY
jgi:N-acetylmuramoyl-L-alanine amidase